MAKRTDSRKWEPVMTLPGGLRLFKQAGDRHGRRWAVADRSGSTPDATADGVQWFYAEYGVDVGAEACGIRLVADNGDEGRALLSPQDALLMAARLELPLAVTDPDNAEQPRRRIGLANYYSRRSISLALRGGRYEPTDEDSAEVLQRLSGRVWVPADRIAEVTAACAAAAVELSLE